MKGIAKNQFDDFSLNGNDGIINDEIGRKKERKKKIRKSLRQKLDWNSNFADNEFSKTKNIDRGLANHD